MVRRRTAFASKSSSEAPPNGARYANRREALARGLRHMVSAALATGEPDPRALVEGDRRPPSACSTGDDRGIVCHPGSREREAIATRPGATGVDQHEPT